MFCLSGQQAGGGDCRCPADQVGEVQAHGRQFRVGGVGGQLCRPKGRNRAQNPCCTPPPAPTPHGYYGPRWAMVGPTKPISLPRSAQDKAVAARLWTEAEHLTDVSLPPQKL